MPLSAARKKEYFVKLKELLGTYNKAFIVGVDNVGSMQLQVTRKELRGKAELLMGKNTMMRKIIKEFVDENPGSPVEKLIAMCRGNVGFVFTCGDLGEVRAILEGNTRPAPARVGSSAPSDVVVPAGPTGCDPGQTAFFQALQIGTKITKGQIEIVNDVPLVTKGEKVTASQAALLQKLNIEPFTYGLTMIAVYDSGSLFDAKVLDITDSVLSAKFGEALGVIAAISLAVGFPTQASVPHCVTNAFKALVAITIGLENYTFDKADMFEEYLKDPSKFAGSGGGGGGTGAAASAAAPAVEEKEEEEEMDLGGGMDMFGGEEAGAKGDY